MYLSVIFLVFAVFHSHSSNSGLETEKLKLPQDYAACPPGVWTCSTGKRSEIVKAEKTSQTVQRRAIKSYPPGIWTFHNDQPGHCPPGMWVCKKQRKRMLKRMLKTALIKSRQDGNVAKLNPYQVSNDACPPGVWTSSTGKRSDIVQKDQVISGIPVVDELFQENKVKEDSTKNLCVRRND